ncbi:MAG: hypothetical protein K2L67_00505 [Clostridia bacterium]|nr:hypothetical protein [Clostridia bacterium]
MKSSMILELAASEECYMEKINISENTEYFKCFSKLREMFEKFCKNMTEEEKNETLWQLETAVGGLEEVITNEYFKHGFKLGLIIAAQNLLE